jgi:Putative polyhydroxyalkanoic acid system protein (PHA_gran_rgn)
MAHLDISIPHHLGQDEALGRLKSAIADAKTQYSDRIQRFDENWNGNVGTLDITAMGQSLRVTLTANPADVNVQTTLPFMAAMFRGQIEDTTREKLGKLLA